MEVKSWPITELRTKLWKHEMHAQLKKMPAFFFLLHVHRELHRNLNSKTTETLSGRLCKQKYIFYVVHVIECYYEKTGWL